MTSSIQGAGSLPKPTFQNTPMSETQKGAFQEITAKYNSSDFSKADFQAMGKEFRQAGIHPSREVKSMLEEQGFNVEQYQPPRPSGAPNMQGPDPQGGPGGMDKPRDRTEGLQQLLEVSKETDETELQELLEEYLAKVEEDTATAEDEAKLTSYLQNNVPLIGFFMDASV